jgi:hypothetical protein
MTQASVAEFDKHVKDVLEVKTTNMHDGFKMYKGQFSTKICPLMNNSKRTRFELDECFPHYMSNVMPLATYITDDRMAKCIFSGACGYFFVFATRVSIDPTLVAFGTWAESAESDDIKQCVFGEYMKKGPAKQSLMITGVPMRLCASCSKPLVKSYKCSRCREAGVNVRYCSKSCQCAHWGVHKPVCLAIACGK